MSVFFLSVSISFPTYIVSLTLVLNLKVLISFYEITCFRIHDVKEYFNIEKMKIRCVIVDMI